VLKKIATKLVQHARKFKAEIVTLHQRLQTITERDLESIVQDRNVYQIARDWMLEVLQFGIVIATIVSCLLGIGSFWNFIKVTIGSGLLLWAVCHSAREFKKSIE